MAFAYESLSPSHNIEKMENDRKLTNKLYILGVGGPVRLIQWPQLERQIAGKTETIGNYCECCGLHGL